MYPNLALDAATIDITPDDRTLIGARVLQSMQASLYSNRMLVAPRRIREVAQEETQSLLDFFVVRDRSAALERGARLAQEGLGQRSVISMMSALRLAGWEIARRQTRMMEMVTAVEAYTEALLEGYMAAFEEDLRREQQRTHEAYVRSIGGS
jgi:hypothetical protein